MNEFERRFLEVSQNHLWLEQAVPPGAIVEYFGYSAQITGGFTSGNTQQALIPIQADSWFCLEYVSGGVILPNGSTYGALSQITPMGNMSLQITDTGSGHELFAAPVPGAFVAGSPLSAAAGIPFIFPTPRLIPPNTNIKVELTQLGITALENPQPVKAWIMFNGARVSGMG